jgi:hypothetical protein
LFRLSRKTVEFFGPEFYYSRAVRSTWLVTRSATPPRMMRTTSVELGHDLHFQSKLQTFFSFSCTIHFTMVITSIMQPVTKSAVYAPREHQSDEYFDLDSLLNDAFPDLQTSEGASMRITMIPNPLATPNALATHNPLAISQPIDHYSPVSPVHERHDSIVHISPPLSPKSIIYCKSTADSSFSATTINHTPPPLNTDDTANNKRQSPSISTSSETSEEELEKQR